MAKTGEGNVFLKHVEKMVLAVCLVVLAVTVVLYPMSQPKVNIDGQELAPAGVDAYLASLAERIQKNSHIKPLQQERNTWTI